MVKSRVWVALGNEGTRLLASTSQQLCSQRTASSFIVDKEKQKGIAEYVKGPGYPTIDI